MLFNHIKYQYHNVTYSSEAVSSTLSNIHTVQDPLVWTPNSGTSSEWLKVNLYDSLLITRVDIVWSGVCDSLKIEYSLDNFNWETLSDTFIPSDTNLSIDYSDDTKRFIFLRLTVNSPVNFIIEDLDVYSDVEWVNESIISHNYLRTYGMSFRDNYPLFPSLVKDMFKMMENYNNIDKTLFDSSVYSSTAVSCSNPTAASGQLSVSGLTLDSSVQYIWDYDDPDAESSTNQNIIVTTDPTTNPDAYEYSVTGTYYPRLLILGEGYILEFVTSTSITV